MEKLIQIIENKIKERRNDGTFIVLDEKNSISLLYSLIENIISNSSLNESNESREVIFLVAPTGSGKDNIFLQLSNEHPEKKYVELNMDMFRKYYSHFVDNDLLNDKDYGSLTNQFSYEILLAIQEILMENDLGANIVLTGTLREIDWYLQLMKEYKACNYKVKICTLAISQEEGLYSIIKRYLDIIHMRKQNDMFQEGTARYTSFGYFFDTHNKFFDNFSYFVDLYNNSPGEVIDVIEIYRRKNYEDDNNLMYSSSIDFDKNPIYIIKELRSREYILDIGDFNRLIGIIMLYQDYLKEQDTFMDIMFALSHLFYHNKKEYPKVNKK